MFCQESWHLDEYKSVVENLNVKYLSTTMTRTENKSEKLTKAFGFWGCKKLLNELLGWPPIDSNYLFHIII